MCYLCILELVHQSARKTSFLRPKIQTKECLNWRRRLWSEELPYVKQKHCWFRIDRVCERKREGWEFEEGEKKREMREVSKMNFRVKDEIFDLDYSIFLFGCKILGEWHVSVNAVCGKINLNDSRDNIILQSEC